MEEKSLTNKNDVGIFKKVKNFFWNLFHTEKTNGENSMKLSIETSVNTKQTEKTSFIDEFKSKQEIMNLQQKYESGQIAEEDINEEDKQKLIELYKEQIETLNNNIRMYKDTLKNYKEQILEIKNNYV